MKTNGDTHELFVQDLSDLLDDFGMDDFCTDGNYVQPKGMHLGDGCYMVGGGPIASDVTPDTQRAARWLRK